MRLCLPYFKSVLSKSASMYDDVDFQYSIIALIFAYYLFTGTVVKTGAQNLFEHKRTYMCQKCEELIIAKVGKKKYTKFVNCIVSSPLPL